jgi:hypothetical protein
MTGGTATNPALHVQMFSGSKRIGRFVEHVAKIIHRRSQSVWNAVFWPFLGFGSIVNVVMSGDSNGSVGREVHIPLVYINYLQRMTARQLTIGRRHRNKVLGGHAMLSYLPIR